VNLLLLLDMATAARGDETAVQLGSASMTCAEILGAAWAGAASVQGASAVAYIGTNDLAFPVALFAASAAQIPFVPLNYRLGAEQLDDMLRRHERAYVVADGPSGDDLAARGHDVHPAVEFLEEARHSAHGAPGEVPMDGDLPALLLYTSGTAAAPKAAVLRHRNLSAYVIGSVEFGGSDPGEAVLVSVPPYHIAGVANLLSNLYLGRRIVYLAQFDAPAWVETVRAEGITHAMVVPTMLARICDVLEAGPERDLPSLRALSYGGARTPAPVLDRTLALLPSVDLTNAYGLTETSSTIAVLGPEDHRAARAGDPVARTRLGSAGRVLPTVEVEVRGVDGVLPVGEAGEIWVRGEQVSGEYAGAGAPLDAAGWFPTRDRGRLDADGYLYIEGRSDDTIIRGGENTAPAEVEEVLLRHPAVHQCAVVGVPDEEWGQRIAAVVVLHPDAVAREEEIQAFARQSLRRSKTPDVVCFVDELPFTETGKLLRRVVLERLPAGALDR
jgi:acyl-CoA synthetase (AMP-forming)/AMP-acid ligase II